MMIFDRVRWGEEFARRALKKEDIDGPFAYNGRSFQEGTIVSVAGRLAEVRWDHSRHSVLIDRHKLTVLEYDQ